MKKTLIPFTLILLFLAQCGTNSPQKKRTPDKPENQKTQKKKGTRPEMPEKLREQVKSGKITREQARKIMARMGGNSQSQLVKIGKVHRAPVSTHLVLNGTVEPERQVEVYARLAAYVKDIVREEGARVKKGQTLALLDDQEIRISYQQAKIQLEQAKITLEKERSNNQRNRELKANDLISEMDFQASEVNLRQAQLEYQNKLENYKNLELQLSYTRITAPVSGYVTSRLIEIGDRITANQHIYTVEDFSPLLVRVHVPAADVDQLKTGIPAQITSDALQNRIFPGTIKLINPRIDEQSGTVKVTIEVSDPSMTLKPGMFVEVKIRTHIRENALVVARTAVQFKRNRALVYTFHQGTVTEKTVKTGLTEGNLIEITAGLAEGDTVVVQGAESLKDQAKVSVLK